ncbi:MAG: hypothetical protein M3O85_01495 [Acidobacteriota bacterium]|nr:hypothetical protein [Acidobacteriota bacterium]
MERPAVLQSARLKLLRTARHLDELKACIAEYTGRNPCEVVAESDSNATVKVYEPPPDDVALIAGEVLYQLKSALDHMAFQLVMLNPRGIALPERSRQDCQFPIWTDLPTAKTLPLPYGVFKNLPGITDEVHAFIESLQPYYGIGATNNYLRFLKGLSNVDKHRHFSVIRTRAQVYEEVTWASGFRSSSLAHFEHNTQIPTPFIAADDERVDVKRSVTAAVSFNEPGALGEAVCLPVDLLLDDIAAAVWIILLRLEDLCKC